MHEPTVASVMTRDVITTRPEVSFKEVVGILAENSISAVPVVDADGHPTGVVSEADALAKQEFHGGAEALPWWAGRQSRSRWHKALGLTARDVMTAPVVTIDSAEPVTAAARQLAEKHLRRLFVVDEDGRLVGVVSRRDVLGVYLRDDDELRAEIEEYVLRKGMWIIPGTVTVAVAKGVVTLEGTLEHRTSTQIVERLTLAVAGVVGVQNQLRFVVDDTTSAGL